PRYGRGVGDRHAHAVVVGGRAASRCDRPDRLRGYGLVMRARGFTLVELIMGIVVVSVAVGGVLLAMRTTVSKSADPMIAHQGIAIAEAYLEEILTKNFTGLSPVCATR